MPATITHQDTLEDTTPTVLETTSVVRTSNTVVRTLIDGSVSVTVAQAGLRRGRHRLFYTAHADALEAFEILSTPGLLDLVYPERTSWSMQLVVTGDLSLTISETNGEHTSVEFDFQEIGP